MSEHTVEATDPVVAEDPIEGPGDTHDDPAPVTEVHQDAPDPVAEDVELDDDGSVKTEEPETEEPETEPDGGGGGQVPTPDAEPEVHVEITLPEHAQPYPAPHAPYDPSGTKPDGSSWT